MENNNNKGWREYFNIIPPVNGQPNVPVNIQAKPFYEKKADEFFSLKDSIWWTLQFIYYNHCNCNRPITLNELDKAHYVHRKVSKNTLINNKNRLLNEHAIRLIWKNAGPKRRTNYYDITDLGILLFEKYLKQQTI